MKRRVIFMCNAFDDMTRTARGISTDSPAASKKIIQLCKALRLYDVKPIVLSMGRGGRTSDWKMYSGAVRRVDGITSIYIPFTTIPFLSQLLSIAGLVYVTMKLRFRGAKHLIFYNRSNAFLPSLLISTILGYNNILDLEDGEILVEKRILSIKTNQIVVGLFDKLCDRALLACSHLKERTSIRPVLCYYGTIFNLPAINKFQSKVVRVLIGGTLSHGTGADLLIEAISQMRLTQDSWVKDITFEVTGKGESLDDFNLLASLEGYPKVVVHGRLSDLDYRDVLNQADVGLSLKLNEGPFANTTFPSKVIEYGAAGLLVLTTDISDVRSIFGDSAIYLKFDNPMELIDLLRIIVSNREEARAYSQNGFKAVKNIFMPHITGKMLADFIFE